MVTFLSGGTGTPKLLWGASEVFDFAQSTVIGNTGDDVEFGGLHISPDIDTVLFERSGQLDRDTWWGIEADPVVTSEYAAELARDVGLSESPAYLSADEQTTGRRLSRWRRFADIPPFMTIGDRDRAHHMVRTRLLDTGHTLTEATRALASAYDVEIDVVPMSNDPVASIIHTPNGEMHFQEYWVAKRAEPTVLDVEFRGAETATTTHAVLDALDEPVVIGPANPVTSLGPMLALQQLRNGLSDIPVVAVSPFIEDRVVSGPAAKLMAGMNQPPSTAGVAQILDMIDAFVLDVEDETSLPVETVRTDTKIETRTDAKRVAQACKRALMAVTDV